MTYVPTQVSQGSKQDFTRWLDDELRKISQALDNINNLELTPLASEPGRYQEGLIIYADGANFDPGDGAGPYYRSNSTWVKMDGSAASGFLPLDGSLNMTGNLVFNNGLSIDWESNSGPDIAIIDMSAGGGPSNVVLQLSFDGSDGATSTTDESASAHTVVFNNNAQIDTAQSVFGGSSLDCPNSADYCSIASSADFNFGTGDFTIELRMRPTLVDAQVRLFYDQRVGISDAVPALYHTNGGVTYFASGLARITGGAISANNWYTIALSRSSGQSRLYVDGTQVGATFADTLNFITSPVILGQAGDALGGLLAGHRGWIEEVRVTKGVGLYTGASYVVDTAEFPAPGGGIDELTIGDPSASVDVDGTAISLNADTTIINDLTVPTIYGGAVAGNTLVLRGSSGSPDAGIIEAQSPLSLTYDTFSNTTPAQQFAINWSPTPSINSNYIGGALQTAGVFDVTTGVFIPAIFSDTNRYDIGAAPAFSAITFINEISVVANNGNFNLPSALVVNVGLAHERNTSGTSTTPGTTGVSFSPQTRATISGAVMTKTDQTAVRCSPTFSTVAGSTVNLGTIRGVHCLNPAVALFQPQAGVETMTAYYGLDFNDISFGGTAEVAVIRSALIAGTNQYFLKNDGNCHSDMGAGHLYFDDDAGIAYGGVGTSAFDVWQRWVGASNYFGTFFNSTADEIQQSSPAADRFLWTTNGGNGVAEFNFDCHKFSLGAQTGAVGNQVGAFVAGTRAVSVGGEWSDFLLTQAGNITVNAAMGLVAGWTVSAPSITLGTGSVTTGVGLNVGGNPNQGTNRAGVRIISNPTGGAGVNAALWVTAGRSQFDGFVDINKPVALGGGAGATLGTIGGSGPTAAAQAQWVEIEINGVRHWLPAWT